MNSRFSYRYRDAGNFKVEGHLDLEGAVTAADEEFVRDCLDSGEYFVAEQVGIPPLYAALYRWSGGPTSDDHCYHEFVSLRNLPADCSSVATQSKSVLMRRFGAVSEWDISLSQHFAMLERTSER